jgi:hypothetical protein
MQGLVNAAILTQLDTALSGLHNKAGVPMHSRVIMNNVYVTTNILTHKKAPPVAPDTSLLDRVKRVPTEPKSSIPNRRPVPTDSIHIKPAFGQPSFARPAFPSRFMTSGQQMVACRCIQGYWDDMKDLPFFDQINAQIETELETYLIHMIRNE